MRFIPLHGLNGGNQKFRFFLNVDNVVSVYPTDPILAYRGYRSRIVMKDGNDLDVTESVASVVKRLNGEAL